MITSKTMRTLFITITVLIIILFTGLNIPRANGALELKIDGPSEYIMKYASKGSKDLYVDVPSDYQGNTIIFRGISRGDSHQSFLMSYLNNKGKYVTSESHRIKVPVTPGKRVYLRILVTGKRGYSYCSIEVYIKSVEPEPSFTPESTVELAPTDTSTPEVTDMPIPEPTATPEPVSTDEPVQQPDVSPYQGTAVVKIENRDDDSTHFTLYIDNKYNTLKFVKSSDSFIKKINVTAGSHRFKVMWKDPDTDEWNEDRSDVFIAQGKEQDVYLKIRKNEYTKKEVRETDKKICYADVKVENMDNDDLRIDLYINGNIESSKTVKSGDTIYYGKFPVSAGRQHFETRWYDPDYKIEYIQKFTADFEQGQSKVLSLYAEKHEKIAGSIEIHVKNKDDDNLKVDLIINGIFKDQKTFVNNTESIFGTYSANPGTVKLSIEWKDPDTRKWHKNEKTVLVENGKTHRLDFEIARKIVGLEVYTNPKKVTIENGTEKNIKLYFNNKGTIPAQDIKVSTKCKSRILKTEKDFMVVSLEPGEGTYTYTTIEALEKGQCELKLSVWGVNFDAISLTVPVEVKGSVEKNIQGFTLVPDSSGKVKKGKTIPSHEQKRDEYLAESLGEKNMKGFSTAEKTDGIDVKLDMYGEKSGKYAYVNTDTVYMKFDIKNTGKFGMWVRVIPFEPDLEFQWKGKAVVKLPDRWRAPFFDDGVLSPYKEFNSLYYNIESRKKEEKRIEGLAYIVPGEKLKVIMKFIPKQEGIIIMGGDVFYTNPMSENNELPLVNSNNTYSAINATEYINIYGHRDESFHIQNLKTFDNHFRSISTGLLELNWNKWVKLDELNKLSVEEEIKIEKEKTFGQKASNVFENIFSW